MRRAMALAALWFGIAVPAVSAETVSYLAQREASELQYQQVVDQLTLSTERLEGLKGEVDLIRKDHASLTAALIQAAKTEKKLTEDIDAISQRLEALRDQEDALRQSLATRRAILAEVLAGLQRMGLSPPPAILVRPEDALASVRSAILLGAVVPELRSQTEVLVADLTELSRVAVAITEERGKLMAAVGEQLLEKERLSLLLEQKQKLQEDAQASIESESRRAAELAERAKSLKELIAGLEKQAEEARRLEEERRLAEERRKERDREFAAIPVPEANRLAKAPPFAAMHGQLPLPVVGRRVHRFGEEDENGGVVFGDTVATQSRAIVTAPADGTILYAGPFRSYGQLLIVNVGDGYHLVLAGLGRISVTPGQSVLAGEPVGAMGETRMAAATASAGRNAGPELYVEFRKDGKPVDPAPWWSERLSGRTGNGT